MKSFICSTDAGDMILTVKYNQEHENFKLYLNGIQSSFSNNGLNFYSDNNSCPIKPQKQAIFAAAHKLVNYHHMWFNQADFERWFSHYWDSYSKEDLHIFFS